jgi:hypothetical protein
MAFLTALLLVLSARAADPAPFPPASFPVKVDWSWVKSAIFVPTNCVNDAQQWVVS